MTDAHLPVLVTVLPLVAALVLPLMPRRFGIVRAGLIAAAVLAVTSIGAVASLGSTLLSGPVRYTFGGWSASIGVEFVVTTFSAPMAALFSVIAFLVVVYALREVGEDVQPGVTAGYYTLILVTTAAMLGMVYTNDLFNMYVFMEMLSIASCAIVTINGKRENLFAGLKYLIIGTVGSITVLFGIALLYMVSGTLNMSLTREMIPVLWEQNPLNVRMAIALIITGFGIKAAVFPMHTWLPDAHSVAPAPSSALLSALVVKAYLLGAIKVLFVVVGLETLLQTAVPLVLTWVGLTAMLAGSGLALGQTRVKRVLAYSTVAHIGYIVLGIGLASPAGLSAALFHIIAHALLKTALFLSVGAVIHHTGKQYVSEIAGVGYRMPVTMLVFSVAALGMIGIPGTNGFMSKWYLILAAAEARRAVVLPIILVSSFLNALYYVPIVTRAFIQRSSADDHIMKRDRLPYTTSAPLVIIAGLVILTGLYPELIMVIIRQATNVLIQGF